VIVKLTAKDIGQWIDNDEGLYVWWKRSKLNKTMFIRENREELERCIGRVLSGNKPAHYLRYGG
jgi:hypothetical protein